MKKKCHRLPVPTDPSYTRFVREYLAHHFLGSARLLGQFAPIHQEIGVYLYGGNP